MSKFKLPKRYDMTKAEEGVWFDIADDNGVEWGKFKCRLIDDTSQRSELAYKRIRMKYASDIKTKKLNEYDSIKVVFCEASLLDWAGIQDEKGKDIPFSLNDALEYFGMEETRWLLLQLSRLASDYTNFAADPTDAELPEKNS